MPKAYTYLIVRKSDRKRYIGSRWANRLDPKGDLGVEYFTSSDSVRPEFKRNPSAFMFRVLREFDTQEEACAHERALHIAQDVKRSLRYVNLAIAGTHGSGVTERPVIAWSAADGGKVAEYVSASVAARELRASDPSSIVHCLRGGTNSKGYPCRKAQGFLWTYKEEPRPFTGVPSAESHKRCDALRRSKYNSWALDRSQATLTDKQLEAFTLVRIEGKTLYEARDIMGFKYHNSVVNHLKNAEKKIKEALPPAEE